MISLKFTNVDFTAQFLKVSNISMLILNFFMFYFSIFDYIISSSDYSMVSLSPHTSITIVCACQTAMDDLRKM